MKNNFLKRLISSLFIIPVVFFIIFKDDYLFNLFLMMCLIISLYEWNKMIINQFFKILGIFFILMSFYSAYYLKVSLIKFDIFSFLVILLICIFTDIGGYSFGKIFRGPKLNKISPNKTYAGALGGVICSLIFLYLSLNYVNPLQKFNIIFDFKNVCYVVIFSLISQIGDFIVSYFKRISNLKDTGKLIPGHGGILDRIDGMIFVFISFYIINNFYGI